MKNPFSRFGRARDKPTNAVSTAPSFLFGPSGAGKSVSVQSAIQVSAVYACVRVIAETIASLPLHVYKVTDTGSEKATQHSLYRLLH
ncbi:MAG: phage portal protein, partial [bacterium]|nr:phage portal protein [bacterium]